MGIQDAFDKNHTPNALSYLHGDVSHSLISSDSRSEPYENGNNQYVKYANPLFTLRSGKFEVLLHDLGITFSDLADQQLLEAVCSSINRLEKNFYLLDVDGRRVLNFLIQLKDYLQKNQEA